MKISIGRGWVTISYYSLLFYPFSGYQTVHILNGFRLCLKYIRKSALICFFTIAVSTPAAVSLEKQEMDEEELKRRTAFLRAQRDKLLAMKKEEREKQLAEAEKAQMKARPKSARAARSAFSKC